MNANWIIGISFGLSVLFVLAAVIAGICLHRAELFRNDNSFMRHIFTSFRVFLILFFIATVCALYPVIHLDPEGSGDFFRSSFASFIKSFQLFFMEGDYVESSKIIESCGDLNPYLSYLFLVYLACVYLVAPIFTLSFILSFFRDISSTIRFAVSRWSDLYLFSELNERSLALAEDVIRSQMEEIMKIREEERKRKNGHVSKEEGGKTREEIKEERRKERQRKRALRRKRLIVFTDVFSNNEERTVELIASARRLGALCLKKDVTEIGLDLKKRRIRKIYLIGDNEDENIQQALTLINYHAGKKSDTETLDLYVFSNSAESEALLTSVYNISKLHRPLQMKIRRINENRQLALQELIDNPIFQGAVEEDGVKKIRLLLVGLGGYGTELLKAFCWCAQMPGYSLELHVFEKEEGKEKIKAIAPELIKLNHKTNPLEAQYDIFFHDGIDVASDLFGKELEKIKDITGVYVSLGDDERNIETALRIRTVLERNRKEGAMPPIYPIVYSASKADSVALAKAYTSDPAEKPDLFNMEGTAYNVFFIGALKMRYTLKSIERTELEKSAMRLHLDWIIEEMNKAETDEEQKKYKAMIEEEKVKYFQFEYYRNSSMARAVYEELRGRYVDVGKEDGYTLKVYEHRRWNVYMRADGYICAPKPKNHIAKTHFELVPYDQVPKEDQGKDN